MKNFNYSVGTTSLNNNVGTCEINKGTENRKTKVLKTSLLKTLLIKHHFAYERQDWRLTCLEIILQISEL